MSKIWHMEEFLDIVRGLPTDTTCVQKSTNIRPIQGTVVFEIEAQIR